MPWAKDTATATASTGRADRIEQRARSENWKKPPRRIETSECITCDTCLRNCPPEFGAIFDRGLDVVIIPELCSGCPVCIMVCPVDCIYEDDQWTPTDPGLWDHIQLTVEGVSS
jgi:electron transport complex protein RnfB